MERVSSEPQRIEVSVPSNWEQRNELQLNGIRLSERKYLPRWRRGLDVGGRKPGRQIGNFQKEEVR